MQALFEKLMNLSFKTENYSQFFSALFTNRLTLPLFVLSHISFAVYFINKRLGMINGRVA